MNNFAAKTILDFDDGPLVWIDCEMTGLNPRSDKIMEIAVLITNGNLELVDEGIEYVIKVDETSLAGMDGWCTRQHGLTGLTQQCRSSSSTLADVSKAVLAYIQEHVPQRRAGILSGSSVHCDKAFLASQMPEVNDWLHYRIVDVSSIKELCRRWYPGAAAPARSTGNVAHRALDDIKESIRELQWYRKHIFIPPNSVALGQNTENDNINDTAADSTSVVPDAIVLSLNEFSVDPNPGALARTVDETRPDAHTGTQHWSN